MTLQERARQQVTWAQLVGALAALIAILSTLGAVVFYAGKIVGDEQATQRLAQQNAAAIVDLRAATSVARENASAIKELRQAVNGLLAVSKAHEMGIQYNKERLDRQLRFRETPP